MKEAVSAFGSDVIGPLVRLIVPGSIAVAPGLAALLWRQPWLCCVITSNRNEFAAVLVLLVLFAGLLCEDLGSHLEEGLDVLLERKTKGAHIRDWYAYLRIAYRIEPIGHRHMRTLVMRLKFELGSCGAFVFAVIGILCMPMTWDDRALFSIIPAVLIAMFCYEAWETTASLSELRTELLKGVREWPEPLSQPRVEPG